MDLYSQPHYKCGAPSRDWVCAFLHGWNVNGRLWQSALVWMRWVIWECARACTSVYLCAFRAALWVPHLLTQKVGTSLKLCPESDLNGVWMKKRFTLESQWSIRDYGLHIGSASNNRNSLRDFGAVCFVSAFFPHTNDSEAVAKLTCVAFRECESNGSGSERGIVSQWFIAAAAHIRTSQPLGASDTGLQRGPAQSRAFKTESLIQYQTSH